MIGSHDQSLFCRNSRLGQIAITLERYFQELPHLRLIIYYEYLCLAHSSITLINEVLTGMDITNLDPEEFDFSSSTLPPNASVNPFTIDRPSPDPLDIALPERENLSKTLFTSPEVNP